MATIINAAQGSLERPLVLVVVGTAERNGAYVSQYHPHCLIRKIRRIV